MNTKISSLVPQLLERRYVALIRDSRLKHREIANRMSALGTVNGSGFIHEVRKAYIDGFETYARESREEVIGLVQQDVGRMDIDSASWIKQQLEPDIERVAVNVANEAKGGGQLRSKLQESVQPAMRASLAAMKRDLQIALDIATIGQREPVVDEALKDVLVPLQNKRGLELVFPARTSDESEPLVLVLFDIDNFKSVNDDHGGHATGDEALVEIAKIAAACVKGKGTAYRVGGDEFVLLLPNHTLDEGMSVAERFRREVNSSPRTSRSLTLGVSVGVAVWPDNGKDLGELRNAADNAMYDSKKRGRNRVSHYREPEPLSPSLREPELKKRET